MLVENAISIHTYLTLPMTTNSHMKTATVK